MFRKEGTAEGGGGLGLDIERSNKIILLLFGALALLIFMDGQAFRHYSSLTKKKRFQKEMREFRKEPEKRLKEFQKKILEPAIPAVRRRAGEVFGKAQEFLPTPPQVKNTAGDLSRRARTLADDLLLKSRAELYYLRFRGRRSELVRVKRRLDKVLGPAEVLELLQRGPRTNERGLLNAFDSSIRLLGFHLEKGVAYVNLDESFTRNSPRLIRARLHQLIFTLAQFPGIQRIGILINGRQVDEVRGVPIRFPKKIRIRDFLE